MGAGWPGSSRLAHELRRLCEGAGIGLRQMAEVIGRDRGHLSRVERGEREVTPALVREYQRAAESASLDDVDRRELLALGLGAALPLALAGAANPRRVGAAEIEAIRSAAPAVDTTTAFGLDVARDALRRALRLLPCVPAKLAKSARSAVALLALEIGWGEFSAGLDPSATLSLTQRLSRDAADGDVEAHALLNMAVSQAEHDPRLAMVALGRSANVAGSESQRAMVHVGAADVLAPAYPALAREHLARARDMDPTDDAGTPESARTFALSLGLAEYSLGMPSARDSLTDALGRLSDRNQRTRARAHAYLGILAARDHDEVTAETHLRAALTAPRSRLVVGALRAFATEARQAAMPELAREAARAA